MTRITPAKVRTLSRASHPRQDSLMKQHST